MHTIINEHFINQIPGYFGIVDVNSKFLVANKTASEWLAFRSTDVMIGGTYYDIPCKVSEGADIYIQQDNLARNLGHIKLLAFCCYADDTWKIIVGEKYLLKNKNDKIIGLAHHFNDFTDSMLVDISRFLMDSFNPYLSKNEKKQFCYTLDDSYQNIKLSPKQSECLFFLLRGKTIKEIAQILSLSARTVEHYIDEIKYKLQCATKSDLIEKALMEGYMNILPKALLDSKIKT